MARQSASANASKSKKPSSAKARASASRRSGRRRCAARPPRPRTARLLDERTRHDIAGVAFAVAGRRALLVAAVLPTDAIVTSFLSTALHLTLGPGRLPAAVSACLAIGVSFLVRFDRERVPARVAVGLALVFFAVLVLLALFTPTPDPHDLVGALRPRAARRARRLRGRGRGLGGPHAVRPGGFERHHGRRHAWRGSPSSGSRSPSSSSACARSARRREDGRTCLTRRPSPACRPGGRGLGRSKAGDAALANACPPACRRGRRRGRCHGDGGAADARGAPPRLWGPPEWPQQPGRAARHGRLRCALPPLEGEPAPLTRKLGRTHAGERSCEKERPAARPRRAQEGRRRWTPRAEPSGGYVVPPLSHAGRRDVASPKDKATGLRTAARPPPACRKRSRASASSPRWWAGSPAPR